MDSCLLSMAGFCYQYSKYNLAIEGLSAKIFDAHVWWTCSSRMTCTLPLVSHMATLRLSSPGVRSSPIASCKSAASELNRESSAKDAKVSENVQETLLEGSWKMWIPGLHGMMSLPRDNNNIGLCSPVHDSQIQLRWYWRWPKNGGNCNMYTFS